MPNKYTNIMGPVALGNTQETFNLYINNIIRWCVSYWERELRKGSQCECHSIYAFQFYTKGFHCTAI